MADDRRIQIPVNLISCDDIYHSAKGTTWKKHKYIKKEGGRYFYPKEGGGSNTALTLASKEAKALLEKGKDFIDFQLNDPSSWVYRKMTNLMAAFGEGEISPATVGLAWVLANSPDYRDAFSYVYPHTPKGEIDHYLQNQRDNYDRYAPLYDNRVLYDDLPKEKQEKFDEQSMKEYREQEKAEGESNYKFATSKVGERLIKQDIADNYDIPEKPRGYKNRAEKIDEMYDQIVYAEASKAGGKTLEDYKEKKKSKK